MQLKLATQKSQTCELLSTVFMNFQNVSVFMNFQNVSHEALAYILIKLLFVVVYRPVRGLVNEIIQETD